MQNFPKICVYNIDFFVQKRTGHTYSVLCWEGITEDFGNSEIPHYIISDDFRCALVSAVKNDEATIVCVTKFHLVVVQT